MGLKIIKKLKKRIIKKAKQVPILPLTVLVVFVGLIVIMNQDKRLSVVPSSYRPLLELIASAESRGNYNAYFGNANNSKIDFTKMTIAEVQQWQKDYLAQGSPSSAVGRYQLINTTLAEIIREVGISQDQLFDKSTQDSIAMALLEKRGSVRYANDEISQHEFAANIAMEWASLPKVIGDNTEASYYDSDGLNKSLVGTESVLRAIDSLEVRE